MVDVFKDTINVKIDEDKLKALGGTFEECFLSMSRGNPYGAPGMRIHP